MLKMAQYCKEVFGTFLLTDFLEKNPTLFAAPSSLTRKILIKNKKNKPGISHAVDDDAAMGEAADMGYRSPLLLFFFFSQRNVVIY